MLDLTLVFICVGTALAVMAMTCAFCVLWN